MSQVSTAELCQRFGTNLETGLTSTQVNNKQTSTEVKKKNNKQTPTQVKSLPKADEKKHRT